MNRLNAQGQNVWRVVAVALLPVMVLGLLLAALWDPQERLDTVKAAIVNNDEPVTMDGQLVPLGRQLAAGLVSGEAPPTEQTAKAAPPSDASYDWEITDADHAAAGLADGTYAAVVTIPEDFSAAATSFGGDDPTQARQATIDVATPPGGRVVDAALARVVANAATSVMGGALTETYVDNVLVGFNTLHEQLGQAADGAGQLASGAGDAAGGASQLADGAGQLADGAGEAASGADQLADGASQLASGARSAAGGASQLADGAQQAASGASGLAGGASQLADGAGQLAAGVSQSAAGARALADNGDQVAAGASSLAGGVHGLADGLAQIDSQLPDVDQSPDLSGLESLSDLASTLGQLVAVAGPACQAGALPQDLCGALAGVDPGELTDLPSVDQMQAQLDGIVALRSAIGDAAAGAEQLAGAADQVAAGSSGIAGGTRDLAGGLDQLQGGAAGLQQGAQQLAGGATALAGGVGQVAGGARELSGGVGQLASGASGLSSGAGSLAGGVDQLATGASGLSTGAGELAGGVGQLADGAGDLSDGLGQAVDQIPSYTDDQRRTLASVVADPVAAPGADGIDAGSTGPLFAVVALWLGALGLTTVLRPSPARALGSTRGSLRLALADLALPSAIAVGTGAVVGGVLAGVEGLSPLGWLGAMALGALVSVVFVAVHQGFCLLLGDVGRGVSLLMAVLVIATGVVATVPVWLESVADLLAVGAAREALVGLVVPDAGGVAPAVVALVLWGLAGLAVAVFATARRRTVRVADLLPA
ncbi:hypothetical protein DNL40_07970 [Xylanimonas oleitrophica]|uniref:YhgE/Pip domain-containing protein n=1 Tax=Xylanimonas oleitrophica TaxID=2607479 RepID=A0A2W5WZS3_9MICO|nr:YhgE/Pip domain-containing protein [Xylanimonas oleitrophica]PZR53435.1 hypothetical protein DNL40_07970 [Xylanimonas oleitrophica]